MHLVRVERPRRRAVDHGSGENVEPGTVTLAHDHGPCEQASGQGAGLLATSAEVIEGVDATVDTRDRDPQFALAQVIGNDEVVGGRLLQRDNLESISSGLSSETTS